MGSLNLEKANKILLDKGITEVVCLEYIPGPKNLSKFLDSEYGEFQAKFYNVKKGQRHPDKFKNEENKIIEKAKLKREQTFQSKYGVSNPSQLEEVKQKKKETCLQNYGVEVPLQNKDILEKAQNTLLEKTGYKNPSQVPKYHQEKIKTNQKKLGVNYPTQHPQTIEKSRDTFKRKYNTDWYTQTEEFKEKVKITSLLNWGTENPSQSREVKLKVIKTNMKKFGVAYPNLDPAIAEENSKKIHETFKEKGIYQRYDGKTANQISKEVDISLTTVLKIIQTEGYEAFQEYILTDKKYRVSTELPIKRILDKHNIAFNAHKQLLKTKYNPDFIISDSNLIIECDGLLYHSDAVDYRLGEKFKSNNYHAKKRKAILQAGYKALFFRENEIKNQLSIIESIILNKLGKSKRIFARKCQIKELSRKEAKLFFFENHLMGPDKGTSYGLFYQDKLVSAIQIQNKKEGLHIARFCCKINTSVVGGLSKLLKHCIKIYNPPKVISFVDLRYGDGSSLEKLGFKKIKESLSFQWTDFKDTYHRMKYPKKSGYECGLAKIYDCGQARYELIL